MRRFRPLSLLLCVALSVTLVSAAFGSNEGPRGHRHGLKARMSDSDRGRGSDKGGSSGSGSSNAGGNSGQGNSGQGNGNGGNSAGTTPGNSGSSSGTPGGDTSDKAAKDEAKAEEKAAKDEAKTEEKVAKDAEKQVKKDAKDEARADKRADKDSQDKGKGKGKDADAGDDDSVVADEGLALEVPSALRVAPIVEADDLPAALRPDAAGEVLVAATAGEVFVDAGPGGFVPLDEPIRVPAGALVDARAGVLALVDRLPNGKMQTALFGGSKFQVREKPHGMTAIVLRGESFSAVCGEVLPIGRGDSPAAARAARATSKKRVRSLWASDNHGSFQTYGRNSVATVRGTVWETVDRCDGTLIRVASGKVIVHDRNTGKKVGVTAGHSYLARNPNA